MNTPTQYNHILITAAVPEELVEIFNAIENASHKKTALFNAQKGYINKIMCTVAATGPGIINTAAALVSLVEEKKPDMIIQTGCAGLFPQSGLTIGDIAVASGETDIHIGVEPVDGKQSIPVSPLPFCTIPEMGITSSYPTDKALSVKACDRISAGMTVTATIGPFITVSTITATQQRAEALYKAYQPVMESMEGAATAHIAALYGIPFIEIRSASNHIGERDKTKWNLPLAFKNGSRAVLEFLYDLET